MFKRQAGADIIEALQDTPVVVLNGARQTGKTTLCKELIHHKLFSGEYITFDTPSVLKAAKEDPLGFLKSRGGHIVLDEIQKVPELLVCIKQMVDEDRKNRRYILTGSANVMSLPRVSDSLAGRIEIHPLWPFSQAELHDVTPSFLEKLVAEKSEFKGSELSWQEYAQIMEVGGYPEAWSRKAVQRRSKWFAAYMDSILQRDIKNLTSVEGLLEIPNVLHLLASRVGGLLNFSEIARLAKLPQTTLKRYYSLLLNIFLVVEIPPWTPNLEGRFVKAPKTYLNDSGLLCYLQNINKEHLHHRKGEVGSVFENFVIMEIVKQLGPSGLDLKLYHFRTHTGIEVDLVLEDRNRNIYGVEIKSSESPDVKDFKGLKYLQSKIPDRFKKGIVVHTGEHFFGGFGKDMYAVPVSSLWDG